MSLCGYFGAGQLCVHGVEYQLVASGPMMGPSFDIQRHEIADIACPSLRLCVRVATRQHRMGSQHATAPQTGHRTASQHGMRRKLRGSGPIVLSRAVPRS